MSKGGIDSTARIVGEAVSVSMGSREVYAKIVGEAVCVSMTNIEVNARIVGEAVSVSTGGGDITASIVGREGEKKRKDKCKYQWKYLCSRELLTLVFNARIVGKQYL